MRLSSKISGLGLLCAAHALSLHAAGDAFDKAIQPFLAKNCYGCHNANLKSGGLDLQEFKSAASVGENRGRWEKLLQKLRSGEMPPKGVPRPGGAALKTVTSWIESEFDRADRLAGPSEDRKSVLDYVNHRTQKLMGTLGAPDRQKLDEYLTAIREIEKRIERAENDNRQLTPEIEKPTGMPTSFADHVRLMHDLLVVAFQADITRIATLLYSREGSNRSYPELGFTDGHHPITHHRNIPDLEKVTKINGFHVEQFAYLIQRLKSIREGDGTLLDHCMIVYGSSISDGNVHAHTNLPVVIFGRGDGSLKPGRHIVYPETPMTNLFLTLLDRAGVPSEKLGDSNGRIEV